MPSRDWLTGSSTVTGYCGAAWVKHLAKPTTTPTLHLSTPTFTLVVDRISLFNHYTTPQLVPG